MADSNDSLSRAAVAIGQLAWKALIEEVVTTPKPGLVDLYSNGAHTDMDVDSFRRSAEALRPFFALMAERGIQEEGSPEKLFLSIRGIGMQAEKAMYAATGGVNTHKGIIFTFGVFCAAAGRCIREKRELTPENLLFIQQEMTVRVLREEVEEIRRQTACRNDKEEPPRAGRSEGWNSGETTSCTGKSKENKDEKTRIITEKSGEKPCEDTGACRVEFEANKDGKREMSEEKSEPQKVYKPQSGKLTHGENNMRRYGTAGIRGEAIEGYPGVFQIGLPVIREGLRRCEDWNLIKLQTLLSLMAKTEDSNILSRGGMEELRRVQTETTAFLQKGGAYRPGAVEKLKEMDADYIRRNCSPGGCADLLATAIFIDSLNAKKQQ